MSQAQIRVSDVYEEQWLEISLERDPSHRWAFYLVWYDRGTEERRMEVLAKDLVAFHDKLAGLFSLVPEPPTAA